MIASLLLIIKYNIATNHLIIFSIYYHSLWLKPTLWSFYPSSVGDSNYLNTVDMLVVAPACSPWL